jgi:hypothetical protein
MWQMKTQIDGCWNGKICWCRCLHFMIFTFVIKNELQLKNHSSYYKISEGSDKRKRCIFVRKIQFGSIRFNLRTNVHPQNILRTSHKISQYGKNNNNELLGFALQEPWAKNIFQISFNEE